MILVKHPPNHINERQYVFDVILREFLGLDWKAQEEERENISLTCEGDSREILMSDALFSTSESEWLTNDSLPIEPLQTFEISESAKLGSVLSIPVIYGEKNDEDGYIHETAESIFLGIDIFGSAFFSLTRYEEIVCRERDSRNRFSSISSISMREGFLERPIVNEYVELLWNLIKNLWPDLKRRERSYRFHLSHDVDHPAWVAGKSWNVVLKNAAGDLVRRRDASLAIRRVSARIGTGLTKVKNDPANCFDFIMDLSDQFNIISAFYFIADRTAGEIDGYYSLDDPWIRDLLKEIHRRGHEIGLHPSYNTFQDPEQIKQEFCTLHQACEDENIQQASWGGRQHFLRWEAPTTWQAWEDVGLAYDSTLSFSDHIGFRCGTCYEFPVFNLETRKRLNLRERPLVVMDGTLFDYMKLSDDEAIERTLQLAEKCRLYDGEFSLLWHNSELLTRRQKEIYKELVAGCAP
jgi:hypothetical protein